MTSEKKPEGKIENTKDQKAIMSDRLIGSGEETRSSSCVDAHPLSVRMHADLHDSNEREFLLNQAQRIARIGSWEYRNDTSSLFWSDEMYNIFGIDTGFTLEMNQLLETINEDASRQIIGATADLVRTGQPYDITIQTRMPLGYLKWIRICAFPIRRDNRVIGASGICHDITYYKEAELRLLASENRYRSLFEQASDAILITDANGSLMEVNTSLCRMLGYSREELLTMNVASLVDNCKQCDFPLPGDDIFKKGQLLRKNGFAIEVEATVKKFDTDRIMAIVRDVTEIRKAQKQIQISEARFRSAFEFSAIGMALVSLEGRIVKVNRQLCKITGYTAEELLCLDFQSLTHPDDLPQDIAFVQATIHGEIEAYKMEKRYFHKNGSVVWVNLTVSIVKDDQGSPLYFVSQVEDITEDKISKEKLMLSQANLNATINNTEIHIWSVDRNFDLLTFNKPFARYMAERHGITLVPGKGIFGNLSGTDVDEQRRKWNRNYLRALSGEIVTLEECEQGVTFQYSLSPIIEEDQVMGVSVIAEDITERKNRDRELAEANKKIAELKLMALRSVMNPHFIFNVLSSIQFFIARNDKVNAIHYLSTFSRLIRSILTHSVKNTISLSDEIAMLKNYVELEMTRFEDKFEFVLDINPGVDTDAIRIPSLLIQPFVENAILHGLYNKAGKGRLSIRIHEREESVVFEIEDNGIGRKEATKLRQRNAPGHRSLGSKLTEERLKLIGQQSRTLLEIVDLHEGGVASGTKVIICIPF